MSTYTIRCSRCQASTRISRNHVGDVHCSSCGHQFSVENDNFSEMSTEDLTQLFNDLEPAAADFVPGTGMSMASVLRRNAILEELLKRAKQEVPSIGAKIQVLSKDHDAGAFELQGMEGRSIPCNIRAYRDIDASVEVMLTMEVNKGADVMWRLTAVGAHQLITELQSILVEITA